MSFAERAARGATAFDRARPGWSGGISPGTVDVRSLDRCPAAHVFGSYDVAIRELRIANAIDAAELGLDVYPHENNPTDYLALTEAWENEIHLRVNHR